MLDKELGGWLWELLAADAPDTVGGIGVFVKAAQRAEAHTSIPRDPAALATILDVPVEAVNAAWPWILQHFQANDEPDRLVCPAIEEAKDRAASLSSTRARSARGRSASANELPSESSSGGPSREGARKAPGSARVPKQLQTVVAWWNALPAGWIGRAVRTDPIGSTYVTAWRSAIRHNETKPLLKRDDALLHIRDMIEKQPFIQGQSWFTLGWLLGENRSTHERNLVNVMEGKYVGKPQGARTPRGRAAGEFEEPGGLPDA